MLLFAPHRNSFRRFHAGSHAPMAPSWGYDNRTVAVRVPAGETKAMRIEHRVAGADANPHLVIAGILAGMLYGIDKVIDAPAPLSGDAYEQCEPSLPDNWADAVNAFRNSDFVREYLGADLQRVLTLTKEQEMAEFEKHISPLEYQSYL